MVLAAAMEIENAAENAAWMRHASLGIIT